MGGVVFLNKIIKNRDFPIVIKNKIKNLNICNEKNNRNNRNELKINRKNL